MKVLVTGATGFLGSHLAKRLVKEGHEVFCPVRREKKIEGCKTFLEDYKSIPFENFNESIDVFFNCIGHISDHLSTKDLWETNVTLQGKLIEAAKKLGAKRFVHISSVSAVGLNGKDSPIKEDDDLGTGLGYGDTKRAGEEVVLGLGKKLGIEVVVLRPTLIYGEMKDGAMDKIYKVLKTPLRMIGTGNQIWHMVHVEDVVDACLLAASKKDVEFQVFNIVGPDPITANKVVEIACKTLSLKNKGLRMPTSLAFAIASACQTFWGKKKPPFSKFTCKLLCLSHEYDQTKAREQLGFNPKRSFAQEVSSLFSTPRGH